MSCATRGAIYSDIFIKCDKIAMILYVRYCILVKWDYEGHLYLNASIRKTNIHNTTSFAFGVHTWSNNFQHKASILVKNEKRIKEEFLKPTQTTTLNEIFFQLLLCLDYC